MENKTHDTIVIGIKDGKITFFKSYEFLKQRDEAMADLSYVQGDEFTGWYISSFETWMLCRPPKLRHEDEQEDFLFNIPTPHN
jgi:hypothetical protein